MNIVETEPTDAPFAAVVLAGGRGVRLGGADKASVELGGRALLEWVLDAVVDAVEVVVVGDPVATGRPVSFVREDPPHGGPGAALLAGFDELRSESADVVIVAVDMPRLTTHTVRRLRAGAARHDGAALVDPDGRRQLALVLDRAALARARPPYDSGHGLALHRLLAQLDVADVPSEGAEHRDVDSWADLADLSDDSPRG